MDLVVDANILFSILIKEGKTEELVFEPCLHLIAPEFIFQELRKYEAAILRKTSRSASEFNRLLEILQIHIRTISNEETEKYIEEAKKVCPDKNDVDYFALAMKLNCAVWTNDKELKNQKVVKIYNTSELLQLLFG